ncbi:MAG: hypothetical protein ABEH88_05315 [Halobacteriales archaeon]
MNRSSGRLERLLPGEPGECGVEENIAVPGTFAGETLLAALGGEAGVGGGGSD